MLKVDEFHVTHEVIDTEVLELETERLVSSIVVVVKFIVSSFDSVSVLNIGDIGSDFLDV